MNKTTSIKYKAAFLLMVFALNTVVSFACAMGLDMGFNSQHHHDNNEGISASVHHDHDSNNHHEEETADKSKDDDNCCHNSVVQLSQQDKMLTNFANVSLESAVTLVFVHSFYVSFLANSAKVTNAENCIVRWQFPTSPDIRVSIQSFLI